jgi:5-oxoprolinase (ATP-hydrolysing) subunit A
MWLNCDVGESYGAWHMGDDAAIIPHLNQANIACGVHAGDPGHMLAIVQLAKQYGVMVGAHPGYPDKQGFGRRAMALSLDEIYSIVVYQVGALVMLARTLDVSVTYVKPHGALYTRMMTDEATLRIVLQAVADMGEGMRLMIGATLDNTPYMRIAEDYNVGVWFEAFADRGYDDEGQLVGRTTPGAVLDSVDAIVAQAQQLIDDVVVSVSGKKLALSADTLCIHGDNPVSITAAPCLCALMRDKIHSWKRTDAL